MSKNVIAITIFFTLLTLVFPGEQKKNVLLITIDTLRCDRLSVYNKKFVQTKNIDEFASKSVLFKRAFSHTPLTLPAHTNILTGTTPLYHGISDNNRFRLDDKFLTLAEHLSLFGYKTAAFTASFVLDSYFKLDQGFELYKNPRNSNELPAEQIISQAINWIKKNGGPWFLWLHLWDPHTPYSPPEPFKSEYKSDLYSGEVAYTDSQLGILFDFLNEKGITASTSIVLTGDHGESLGEHGEADHGYFAYNSTLHIPLIIFDNSLNHSIIENNVSHIDIFPTICDLLGIRIPKHIQGVSLVPLMQGGHFKEETIYFEAKSAFFSKGWAPLDGFIRNNRKFINLPIKEYYDLKIDFNEQKNIISRIKISEPYRILNSLKEKLIGKNRNLSKKKIDSAAMRKLKTFGYLTGVVQKKRSSFSKRDDLKVLLPIQKKMTSAIKLEKKGYYDDASRLYLEILELRPENIGTYIHLSELYHKIGKKKYCFETLEKGLKRNPANPHLLLRKGILFVEGNKLHVGRKILEEILKNDPKNGEAWNYLGISFFKEGQSEKALDAYRKSEKIDNKNPKLFNNIGTLFLNYFIKYKDMKAHNNAVINFKKALALDNTLPSANNGLGAAYKFIGDRLKAITCWEKAIKYKRDFIQVYFNLAVTLEEVGKTKKARRYLNILKDNFFSRLSFTDKKRLEHLLSNI